MKASLPILLLAAVFGSAAALSAQVISDDFTTLNTSVWTPEVSSGTATTYDTVSGGILSMRAPNASSSVRAFLTSQSTALNPFNQALSFTFTGLTLSTGNVSRAVNANDYTSFYAIVGTEMNSTSAEDPSKYYVGNTAAGGDYLSLQVISYSDAIQLKVAGTNGSTTTTASGGTQTLSGVPTGITWMVDGTGGADTYTITLTGATFSSTGLNTFTGTFSTFDAAGLASSGISRLAVGVINSNQNSALTVASAATLDSVTVDAVPEPGTTLLLLLGGAGALAAARRKAGAPPVRA